MINKGVLRQFLAATAGKKNQIALSEIIKRLYNYIPSLWPLLFITLQLLDSLIETGEILIDNNILLRWLLIILFKLFKPSQS